jgi:DtxR family transcriptional regulator, Mn-dependent transcriptional regulator
MYSFTEENYLKAIYKISETGHKSITTNAIADVLQTKAASVTDMIKKLAEKKLLKYEKYHGVSLTEKGKTIALSTVRKHRLWEVFLYEKLQFGWEEVHDIAEQLEHIHSEVLTDKLDDFLGNPTHDPHGDPIPGKNGEIQQSNFELLTTVRIKQSCVMTGVTNHSNLFLKHLEKVGLLLGTHLFIDDYNEYDGSILIKIGKSQPTLITKEIANHILVNKIK